MKEECARTMVKIPAFAPTLFHNISVESPTTTPGSKIGERKTHHRNDVTRDRTRVTTNAPERPRTKDRGTTYKAICNEDKAQRINRSRSTALRTGSSDSDSLLSQKKPYHLVVNPCQLNALGGEVSLKLATIITSIGENKNSRKIPVYVCSRTLDIISP
jgi:hypothetical protein